MAHTSGGAILADLKAVRFGTAVTYGLDKILDILQKNLAEYNQWVNDVLSSMVEVTTDHARLVGGTGSVEFIETDPFGQPVTKKQNLGSSVAFPIREYTASIGFNRRFWEAAKPYEVAERIIALQTGHFDNMLTRMKKALFLSDNFNFTDPRTGNVLRIKRLLNADGAVEGTQIPDYGGVSFDASTHDHYHYLSSGSEIQNDDLTDLIDEVAEHGHKNIQIQINAAQKSAIAELSKFEKLTGAHVNPGSASAQTDVRDDPNKNPTNYLYGYFDGNTPVWVKPTPQIPANYVLAISMNNPEKVLCYRQYPEEYLQGLMLDAPVASEPLMAENARAIGDMGVNNRSGASILYTSGSVAYVDPTL